MCVARACLSGLTLGQPGQRERPGAEEGDRRRHCGAGLGRAVAEVPHRGRRSAAAAAAGQGRARASSQYGRADGPAAPGGAERLRRLVSVRWWRTFLHRPLRVAEALVRSVSTFSLSGKTRTRSSTLTSCSACARDECGRARARLDASLRLSRVPRTRRLRLRCGSSGSPSMGSRRVVRSCGRA